MSSSKASATEVEQWSVAEVAKYLETLGLSHMCEKVKEAKITGKDLLSSNVSDRLQKAGLSKLQIRKITSRLPEPSGAPTSNVHSGGGGGGASSSEIAALRREIEDLKAQLRNVVNSPTASNGENLNRTIKIPGFCTDCEIFGHQTQFLQVTLGPGESIQAEPGAMVHQSPYIEMKAKTGGQGLERFLTGQRIFVSEFTYHGPPGTADTVAVTPSFPGQIIPIRMSEYPRGIVCQRGSLLASSSTIQVDIEVTESLGAGFFGGEGFVLQRLTGPGMSFLNACGAIIKLQLRPGEVRLVSTGCLVGFQYGVGYRVRLVGGLGKMLLGGEGAFLTELTGPGTVWLESHDMNRLFQLMHQNSNK